MRWSCGRKLEKERRAKAAGSAGELRIGYTGDAGECEMTVAQDLFGVALGKIGGIEETQLKGFILPLGGVGRRWLRFGCE